MSKDLFDQGGFNGLLGVSSIVNAVALLLPGKQVKNVDLSEAVFKKLVEFLESEKQLKKVIFEGIPLPLMKKMIKQTEDFIFANCKVKLVTTTVSKTGNNIDQVWKDMTAYLAKATKNQQLYVVINLQRKHNSWKCITKMSDKQIVFQDSELKLLNKANCTTGKTMEGGHMLSGDAIFGFSLEQPKAAPVVKAAVKPVAKAAAKPVAKKPVAKVAAKPVVKKPAAKKIAPKK